MHISFQLLCRHFLQSLKPLDLENCNERTGLVAEKCLLSDVIADAVGMAWKSRTTLHTPTYDVMNDGRDPRRLFCRLGSISISTILVAIFTAVSENSSLVV